jgi:2-dehydro-3-deoxy-L-rhamnonate dehydrogenase (NAD+)
MAEGLFKGRTAVVTGGARGIGLACAAKIAAGGGRIALWDRDMDRAKQSAASLGNAIAVPVDVTDEKSIKAALATTEKELAAPDILVASAGITGPNTTVAQYPTDAWKQVIDINLTGVFFSNRAVVDGMVKRGWGRIVNIASVAAKRISFTGAASYTASKAGLLGFTRHLAYEVAPHGINVNAICPGPTLTAMYERNADEQTRRERIEMVPKGRWITPDDHGRITVFLCSEAADALCGLAIDVDGGSLLGWMPWQKYMAKRRVRR